MTLVPVATQRTGSHAAVVAQLEELLARAKAGELDSLLWFAEESATANVSWGRVGLVSTSQVVGRIEILKAGLIRSLEDA